MDAITLSQAMCAERSTLHAHAMQLSGSLLAAIGVVEIALRNATCDRLADVFAQPDWLQNPPVGVNSWRYKEEERIKKAIVDAQKADYARRDHQGRMSLDAVAFPTGIPRGISHKNRVKRRQTTIAVPDGQVIMQLTFGFWKGLYSADYEAALWKRSLRKIFPNRSMTRATVAKHLEMIYQTRNRIAHHDSVAGPRVAQVKTSLEFIARNMLCMTEDINAPLAQLLKPHLALVDQHEAAFDACLARHRMPPMPPSM